MTLVDLLSDTTYRQQAKGQIDKLLGNSDKFPVKRAQIYGLRQIARQQPGKVQEFANHQRERARRKEENASERAKPALQAEIEFWTLVVDLCSDSTDDWSVLKEGHPHLPVELRDEKLKKSQKEWLDQWKNEHIPAFFERFCTHAIYRFVGPDPDPVPPVRRVKVIDGPFSGSIGLVVDVNPEKSKITVMLENFRVELDVSQVERRVKVIDGPFSGSIGLVVDVNPEKSKITVMLENFRVELDMSQVEEVVEAR